MSSDGNKSLAFGRTKGRDIDLNAPLKTFTSPARPVSEIITANINFSALDSPGGFPMRAQSSYGNHSVQNEPTHYNNSNNQTNAYQRNHNHRHSIADVIGGQNSQFNLSAPRVARKHDPELMPAQIKYTFRDYAAPSYRPSNQPGSMTTSQSNFLMTSSSAGVSLQRTFAGGAPPPTRGMPKKSISMSRLDQLAQPRRRIVPRPAGPPTPTEPQPGNAAFSRQLPLRNAQHQQPSPTSAASFMRRKPEIPARRPQTAAVSPAAPKPIAKPEVVPKRTSAPIQKPRPKSQIEPLVSLASSSSTSSTQQQPPNSNPPPASTDPLPEVDESKPSDDYKKQMAEKRAAFQKQKLEEERKRQEEEEAKKREEEERKQQEAEARQEEAARQQEAQLKAFEEAEIKRMEAEKQAKELSSSDSEHSSGEMKFVRNLDDSKRDEDLLQKNPEINRDGEMFLVTGEVPKPVDPLVNIGMTQSFDVSMLSSEKARVEREAKERLEEQQAAILKQEELERQKRKSRVAELLKGRTRKNGDGSNGGVEGNSPSGSGPSTPAQKTDSEAAVMAAEQSSDAEQLSQKLNGIAISAAGGDADNAQQNGSNGVGNGEMNGHQQDVIKQFAAENEQSLPPTNGF